MTSLNKGMIHKAYAGPAPNRCAAGRRIARTSSIIALAQIMLSISQALIA